MNTSLLTSLIALNFLQIIWLVTYKRLFNLRESLILTFFILLQFALPFFIRHDYVTVLKLPFYFFQFAFAMKRLKNWFIPSLLISFENSLILLSWIPTLDAWDILYINQQISASTYMSFSVLFMFLQQFLLFLFIVLTNYLNVRFSFTNSIALLPKNYKFLSTIFLFFLFLSINLKQISVLSGDLSSLLYSSFIVIGYTLFIGFTILILVNYNNEKQYIALLTETHDREKKKIALSHEFRKEYKALLLSLTGYLETGDTEKTLELLHSIIDYSDSLLTPNLYKKISNIENLPIQGLLTSFLNRCLSSGVQIDLQITEKLGNIEMNIVDFVRCFSILLDNAYEATEMSVQPAIVINISGDVQSVTVEVVNTFDEKEPIPFQSLLQNNFSTKKGHQGKGLHIFLTILANYKQSSYNISKKNNHFISQFTILKKYVDHT
ncbi:two-component system, LytTR family, sensor histidine kinase AgrC [Enterococcus sp. DIV0212c]|uniref:GHKL domain-containing protein n=1 Tax=Enterococcus sp. DIV0212c TaxID=2230867 RepID=UPI001A9BB3EA|nr:GHKL domain-containing protein [Enterococcus sp. DIV0212c]MBO1354770.1 GHKL domain-containing protein [Enterococcus sp. DIV0212c]